MAREAQVLQGPVQNFTYTASGTVSAGEILKIDSDTSNKALALVITPEDGVNGDTVNAICKGLVRVPITTGVSISAGETVWWDVSTNTASNAAGITTVAGTDFVLGIALEDGTASGGYVDVQLNEGPDAYTLAS